MGEEDKQEQQEEQQEQPGAETEATEAAEGAEAAGAERNGPDWEKRSELGFVGALFGTIKKVMLEPAETFEGMKREGGVGAPLFFFIIITIIANVVNIVLSMGFAIVPVVVIGLIGPFIGAGIIHVMLMILGAAKYSYETTFRTVCYGNAPNALGIVPVIGAIVGGIWGLIVTIIGLSKSQETSTFKAAVAVILPAVVIACVLGVLLGGMILAAIGGAAASSPEFTGNPPM